MKCPFFHNELPQFGERRRGIVYVFQAMRTMDAGKGLADEIRDVVRFAARHVEWPRVVHDEILAVSDGDDARRKTGIKIRLVTEKFGRARFVTHRETPGRGRVSDMFGSKSMGKSGNVESHGLSSPGTG
jgi:hypothetical protein